MLRSGTFFVVANADSEGDMMEEAKTWCVYKITNKENGMVYIGKTSRRKPEYRWNHGKGYRLQPAIGSAIKEYGWESFSHEIIYDGLDSETATRFEIELIAQYDSMNPEKGYNRTAGGPGMLGWHHTETSRAKIIEANKTRIISEESRRKNAASQKRRGTGKKVMQLDLNGNLVGYYNSLKDAVAASGVSYMSVQQRCRKKRTTPINGFYWIYENEDKER